MSFLFAFNRFYLVTFLTEWLALQEYGALDSALCNENQRAGLIELKSQYPGPFYKVFNACSEIPISANLVGWLVGHHYQFGENTLVMMKEENEYATMFLKFDRQQIKSLLGSVRRIHFKLPSRVTLLKAYPTMLLSYCINAESMSLDHMRGRSHFLLEAMAREFSSITELSLTHGHNLCAATLIPVIRNCSKLRLLDLSGSDIECNKKFINAVIVHASSLQRLHFGTKMPMKRDLHRLAVSGRCKLTNYNHSYIDGIVRLSLKGHHLTSLRLVWYHNIFSMDANRLQKTCPNLNCLYIEYFPTASFSGIFSIFSASRLLRFTECTTTFNDECMSLLAAQCPHLQAMDLRRATLSSDGLLMITKLPQLVALTLRAISKVKGDCLSEIMQKCKKIRGLDISGNSQLLDADLKCVLLHCSQLAILNLIGCNESELTPFVVKSLCSSLQELYMITAMKDCIVIDTAKDYTSEIGRFLISEKAKSCVFRPMGVDMLDRLIV